MQHIANSTTALAILSTITTMALQARIQVDDDEELAYLDDPLDNAILQYVFRLPLRPPLILKAVEP